MVLMSLRLGNHIVHIYLHFFMHHIMEQGDHGPLISDSSIFQPKRHDIISIGPPMCGECRLGLVLFCHFYLIVPRESIDEGKDCIGGYIVYQCVYMRKGGVVLWTCPIEVSVIYAHVYFSILFRYRDNISYPVRIHNGT